MKNLKISRTGLCIFLLFVPIIALIMICVSLSLISSMEILGDSTLAATFCMVGMILCVLFVCIYMFKTGPSLVALMLLKRIKKNLDEKSIEELDDTNLFDFIAMMRQKPPADEEYTEDEPSDGEITDGDSEESDSEDSDASEDSDDSGDDEA